jgi:hypothetical protein
VYYHAFFKYYTAEPKNSSIIKSCFECGFERSWKIVPKLRPSSNTVSPNSVKQIQGVNPIERREKNIHPKPFL